MLSTDKCRKNVVIRSANLHQKSRIIKVLKDFQILVFCFEKEEEYIQTAYFMKFLKIHLLSLNHTSAVNIQLHVSR